MDKAGVRRYGQRKVRKVCNEKELNATELQWCKDYAAVLKAVNVCALEPERATQLVVDKDSTQQYDYALQAIKEIPYAKWREYDPEDSVRFFALRLHEVGMIKSSPQKLITQGTDLRFLNELKKELKG